MARGSRSLIVLAALLALASTAQSQPICDAAQFNNRPGVHVTRSQCQAIRGTLKPGTGSTFDGLQLERVELTNATGVTLRNNTIRSNGNDWALAIRGRQRQVRIEGNDIATTGATEPWNTISIKQAHGEDVLLTDNLIRNLSSGGEDLLQMYDWSGTWTIQGNRFGRNPQEDAVDIKYSTVGAGGAVVRLWDNHFAGKEIRYWCVMIHNASDRGISGGYRYTVDLRRNTFDHCQEGAVYHRISTRAGESDPGNRALEMHENVIAGSQVVIGSDNATLTQNMFAEGASLKIGALGSTPRNVQTSGNTFTDATAPARPPRTTPAAPTLPAPRNLRILMP